MSKEKENNFFGKRKPAGVLVENFYVSQEESNMRVKIEHKSGDFNFRLWCGEQVGMWYDRFTKGETSRAYSEIFSGIKVFTILSIQNPEFYRDYSLWAMDYFDTKQKVTTDAESEKIIDEIRAEQADLEKLEDGLDGTDGNGARSGNGEDRESNSDSVGCDGSVGGKNN
jgi:hypothetical protein